MNDTAEKAWEPLWAKTEPIQASKVLSSFVFGLRKGSGDSGSTASREEVVLHEVL